MYIYVINKNNTKWLVFNKKLYTNHNYFLSHLLHNEQNRTKNLYKSTKPFSKRRFGTIFPINLWKWNVHFYMYNNNGF